MVQGSALCIDAIEATNAQYASFLRETAGERPATPDACNVKTSSAPADPFNSAEQDARRAGAMPQIRAPANGRARARHGRQGVTGVTAMAGGVAKWVDACESEDGEDRGIRCCGP